MSGEHEAISDGLWAWATTQEPIIFRALITAAFTAGIAWLNVHGFTDASTAVQAAQPGVVAAAIVIAGIVWRQLVDSPRTVATKATQP